MKLSYCVFNVICGGWIRCGKAVRVVGKCVDVDGTMTTHEGAESKGK